MSETLILRNIHPKFASIIKQQYNIQQQNVKCKISVYFGAKEDDISFRYEQIDPAELNKLARSINKENNGINGQQ